MPRKSGKKKIIFKPWLTTNPNGFHYNEDRWLAIPQNMFMDKKLRELNPSAFRLYLCMACESAGKPTFRFAHSTAKKFGFNHNTFDASVEELTRVRMIREINNDELSKFKTKEFEFTPEFWKVLSEEEFRRLRSNLKEERTNRRKKQ